MPELIIPGSGSGPGSGGTKDPSKVGKPAEGPTLHIDSDWKAQAQAERERLATKEREDEAQKGAGPAGMPPADFVGIVQSLASQALMYMGAVPDETGRAMVVPEYARYHIDLLEALQAKTKGNLTPEEDQALTQVLQSLRAEFVELMSHVAEAVRRRQSGGAGGAGPAVVPGAAGMSSPAGGIIPPGR